MAEKTLTLGVPYLGFLSGRISDLSGYETLANELIQNADDAPGATTIMFDVTQQALIVENDGIFSDCGDQDHDCLWKENSEIGHFCDFHRFRFTSSHDKIHEAEVTGAFGIGFISAYQITDHPELISEGRHWRVRPEKSEDKRILVLEDYPTGFVGTRFIFPWAFDPNTILRQQPGFEPVTRERIEGLIETLRKALPSAMLFLKKIKKIQLKVDGMLVNQIERIKEEAEILIQDDQKDGQTLWNIFEGNFNDLAEDLRRDSSGKIEQGRSAWVTLAIPDRGVRARFFYHATLPTTDNTYLPLHINASFYPSSDRKTVLFDDSYKGDWNRMAIECAARILAQALPTLPEKIGHKDLWFLLCQAYYLKDLEADPNMLITRKAYWEKLEDIIPSFPLVYSSKGEWLSINDTYLLISKNEFPYIPILEKSGIPIVHPDLISHNNLLRKLGVRAFDIDCLVGRFTELELDHSFKIQEAPKWLQSEQNRILLSEEITILLGRLKDTDQQEAIKKLSHFALALSIDGRLCPPVELRRTADKTIQLFSYLQPFGIFLGENNPDGIKKLVKVFSLEDAVRILEDAHLDVCEEIWQTSPDDWISIIKWMEDQRSQLKNNPDLKQSIWNLKIWPSGLNLHALDDLAIPGDFEDPLDLANVIDSRFLKECRRFILDDLEKHPMTLVSYAKNWVPKAFKYGELVNDQKQKSLNDILAKNLGILLNNEDAHNSLAKCPLIYCQDNQYHIPSHVYFDDPLVKELFGENALIAVLPKENFENIQGLWEWLGVRYKPRPQDVIKYIKDIVENQPPSGEARRTIQNVFTILGRSWPKSDQTSQDINPDDYETLGNMRWLPAQNDDQNWFYSKEVYASYQIESFASQAKFIDINRKVQNDSRSFIGALGIILEPTPKQVVDHLFYCMSRQISAGKRIYSYLHNKADDNEIQRLKGTQCLYLEDVGYVFPHQVFWGSHPFGNFRFQLDADERGYQKFYEVIGVRENPEAEDAILILQEISDRYITDCALFDEDTQNVLDQCWLLLGEFYSQENISPEDIERDLGEHRVIKNRFDQLMRPADMMFEDRPMLAEKYGDSIRNNVISKPKNIWQTMRAAGVGLLSEQIHYSKISPVNPIRDQDLLERLSNRIRLIDRIIGDRNGYIWDMDVLGRLDIQQVDELIVESNVRIGDTYSPNFEAKPRAYYDREGEVLYFRQDGRIPWEAIARELAYALNPETEASQFAPEIKEVLHADSFEDANDVLDIYGVPPFKSEIDKETSEARKVQFGVDTGDDVGSTFESDGLTRETDGERETEREDVEPREREDGRYTTRTATPPSEVGRKTRQKKSGQKKFRTYIYVTKEGGDGSSRSLDVEEKIEVE